MVATRTGVRRLFMLIFEGWVPQDKCSSRAAFALGTEIALHALPRAGLNNNDAEDSLWPWLRRVPDPAADASLVGSSPCCSGVGFQSRSVAGDRTGLTNLRVLDAWRVGEGHDAPDGADEASEFACHGDYGLGFHHPARDQALVL